MSVLETSKLKVGETRSSRLEESFPALSLEEKETLVHQFHPDYKKEAYGTIRVGVNKGERTVHRVVSLLEGESPIASESITLEAQKQVDVLIIGGGGAGAMAALAAKAAGAKVLMATKLRLGDSNTVMAEGGMQVAVSPEDSPVRHFLDSLRGGQMANDKVLLKTLVEEGPSIAKWLIDNGVMFDREEDGNLSLRPGGGSSTARLVRCKDYTGLELMRVLKDCVLNEQIEVVEYMPVLELLTDEAGACSGAILKNLDNNQMLIVQAKTVIMATGGIGRLHIQGFPTSNHYGATGDGLPLSYRTGAKLTLQDTFQYHPTGATYPEAMAGILVTEAIRSVGAQLLNANGQRFIGEMETRDAVASAIIRECLEGRGVETPSGRLGVWLDMPLVDVLNGAGTLTERFPNMVRQFSRYDIDITKDPVLIYPTLHYQNGGVKVDVDGESTVQNLFVAGEASGGLHGRNRLMGNSLLDIMVYGKRAGEAAAKRSSEAEFKTLTLQHLDRFHEAQKEAGVIPDTVSPILFPDYVNKN